MQIHYTASQFIQPTKQSTTNRTMALIPASASSLGVPSLLFFFLVIITTTTPTTPLTITPSINIISQYHESTPQESYSSRAGILSALSKKAKSGAESMSGYTIPLFKIPGKQRPSKKQKKHKKPHYVKYWAQNGHPHHKKGKKQGWKMTKQSYFAPGYFVDLTERVLDGFGVLPEFGKVKNKNKGWAKHGNYILQGITMHHGLYTSVL